MRKKKLPPDKEEGVVRKDILPKFSLLLALYHRVTFRREREGIYSTVLKGVVYRFIIKRRKKPSQGKPPLYLFQLSPQKTYISSLFPIDDCYFLEHGGVVATAKLQDEELVLQFRSFGSFKRMQKLVELSSGRGSH